MHKSVIPGVMTALGLGSEVLAPGNPVGLGMAGSGIGQLGGGALGGDTGQAIGGALGGLGGGMMGSGGGGGGFGSWLGGRGASPGLTQTALPGGMNSLSPDPMAAAPGAAPSMTSMANPYLNLAGQLGQGYLAGRSQPQALPPPPQVNLQASTAPPPLNLASQPAAPTADPMSSYMAYLRAARGLG